jgi:hypothetical protein
VDAFLSFNDFGENLRRIEENFPRLQTVAVLLQDVRRRQQLLESGFVEHQFWP